MAKSVALPPGPTLADTVSYLLAGSDPIEFHQSARQQLAAESDPIERELITPITDKKIPKRFR